MTSVLDTLAYHPALKEDGYDSSQGVEGQFRLLRRLPWVPLGSHKECCQPLLWSCTPKPSNKSSFSSF